MEIPDSWFKSAYEGGGDKEVYQNINRCLRLVNLWPGCIKSLKLLPVYCLEIKSLEVLFVLCLECSPVCLFVLEGYGTVPCTGLYILATKYKSSKLLFLGTFFNSQKIFSAF